MAMLDGIRRRRLPGRTLALTMVALVAGAPAAMAWPGEGFVRDNIPGADRILDGAGDLASGATNVVIGGADLATSIPLTPPWIVRQGVEHAPDIAGAGAGVVSGGWDFLGRVPGSLPWTLNQGQNVLEGLFGGGTDDELRDQLEALEAENEALRRQQAEAEQAAQDRIDELLAAQAQSELAVLTGEIEEAHSIGSISECESAIGGIENEQFSDDDRQAALSDCRVAFASKGNLSTAEDDARIHVGEDGGVDGEIAGTSALGGDSATTGLVRVESGDTLGDIAFTLREQFCQGDPACIDSLPIWGDNGFAQFLAASTEKPDFNSLSVGELLFVPPVACIQEFSEGGSWEGLDTCDCFFQKDHAQECPTCNKLEKVNQAMEEAAAAAHDEIVAAADGFENISELPSLTIGAIEDLANLKATLLEAEKLTEEDYDTLSEDC